MQVHCAAQVFDGIIYDVFAEAIPQFAGRSPLRQTTTDQSPVVHDIVEVQEDDPVGP